MKNAEQLAFPNETLIKYQIEGNFSSKEFQGLTKREYFAAMAMQGYLAGVTGTQYSSDNESIARWSVNCADSLLAELEKPIKQNS